MKKKILKILMITSVVLVVVTIIIAEFIAPYAIISPPKLQAEKEHKRFLNGFLPTDFQLNAISLTVVATDGAILSNYLVRSSLDTTKGTIIMLHGIGGCKEDYLGSAKGLSEQGYDCFIYDARAHGKSGGAYCSYGYYEKEDLKAVVTAILKNNQTTKIGLWASSMGAAVALQGLAIDNRIRFGVIESTFTDLSQIVYEYQKRYCFGLGLRFLTNRVLDKAGKIAQFEPSQIRPVDVAQKIEQPILYIHGDADKNINIYHGKMLFEALKSNNKIFYTVKGGGHDNLYRIGGKEYSEKVFGFMEEQFSGN